jgi:tRNA(fMet)-specific endonuclease VapC
VIYLLDTNAVVAILRARPATVRDRLRRARAEGAALAIPSIVLFELWHGVARSRRRRENAERLRVFLAAEIDVVPFAVEDAPIAGDLRRAVEAAGTPIGAYDLLIAAQALRTGATLVTANATEFARVPGLAQQDWSVEG